MIPLYAIWWLSSHDAKFMQMEMDDGFITLPEYLKSELRSVNGRPGRGRLWVSKSLTKQDFQVDPWPDTLMSRYYGECRGIVVQQAEFDLIKGLPGKLTDFELKPLT